MLPKIFFGVTHNVVTFTRINERQDTECWFSYFKYLKESPLKVSCTEKANIHYSITDFSILFLF